MAWVPITNAFDLSAFVGCSSVSGGILHTDSAIEGEFTATLKAGVTAPETFPIRLVFVSGSASDQSNFIYNFALRFGDWYDPTLELLIFNAASGTVATSSLAAYPIHWQYSMDGSAGDVVFQLEIDDFTFSIPGTETTAEATAVETLLVSTSITCNYFFPIRYLFDELTVSGVVLCQPTYRLLNVLTLASEPTTYLELSTTLRENISLDDALSYIANLLAAESLAFTGSPTADITRLLLLAEALAMASGSSTTLEIAQRLLEQMTVQDVATLARTWTVSETLAFADNAIRGIEALLRAQETLAIAESIRTGFVLIAREALGTFDTLASTLEALLRAEDTLAFIGSIPLNDGDYQAWVMNADTTGVTSYTSFPMDSLFTHEGVPYGLTSTGLYRLEGDTDDGNPITAMLATGDIDFGTSQQKNVPRAYLYITQAGACILKTISSIRGSRHETYYELADRTSDGDGDLTYRRVPLGRGVRGEWWRFEVHNVSGSDFDFNGAEVLPVALRRRG